MMTLLKMMGGRGKVKEKEQEGTETDQTHRESGKCKEEGTKTDWGEGSLEVSQGNGKAGKGDWVGGRNQTKRSMMR